jgi:membrane protein DedA with SNARE-associated domain
VITPELLLASASPRPLPGVFHTFEPTLRHWGYLAVAGLLLAENTGVPLPGETVLIAAALYAGTGRLNVVVVGLLALLASVAGSCLGYLIGARGGRPLVERWGRYVRLTPARLDRMEDFFNRHGAVIIVFGRFLDGVRQLLGILSGVSELTFKRFLVYTSLGAAVWCAVWTTLGYVAGNHVETVSRYLSYIGIALALVVVFGLVREFRRGREERSGGG